ncbi:UbiA prenyltransferase family [Favolaschia claudopus]|uniref:UbiA prenyltransferase family n=1 Tax=Favolaschia claudopus TaxID=2862362 RepID=A0AAV9ZTF6_9AGAR
MLQSKTPRPLLPTIQAYADLIRFNKPAGTVFVFIPFAYSLAVSAHATKMPFIEVLRCLSLFAFWAFLARSLACTVNDICDRDIDGQVARTKKRPLPSGRVTLVGATTFLVGQIMSFVAVFYHVNPAVYRESLIWLVLIMVYPWMKRVTNYPQAWLGIAINWGAVIGWTYINENINFPVLGSLMLGLFAWTMFYDTMYAVQDLEDDTKIGIGSSAVATSRVLHTFLYIWAITFAVFMTMVGVINHHGPIFFALSVSAPFASLVNQVRCLVLHDPSTYQDNFARNSRVSLLILGGIFADCLVGKTSSSVF